MKKVYLVTTSLDKQKNTYRKIFLGHWCRNKDYLIGSHDVVRFHWDNRKKLEKDYYYVESLCEKLLTPISKKLNDIHNVNKSREYWRILIGYWLFSFVGALFDRWENISSAFKQFPDINIVSKYNLDVPVPLNVREFLNLSSDVKWNHFIYVKIIEYKKINIEIVEKKLHNKINNQFYLNFKNSFFHNVKLFLINCYLVIFGFLIKKNKYVIFRTYTGYIFEIILNLINLQFPVFILNKNFNSKTNIILREKCKIEFHSQNLFEHFLTDNIFKHIPKDVLEDYKKIETHIGTSMFPKNPRVIISTRSIAKDNIFLRYCAEKKSKGTKLIYCQHGGAYGQLKFGHVESHEIKISDRYLTWGWKKKNSKKTIPFGVLKNINYPFKINNNIKNICYFIRSRSKYTNRIDASIGTNQMSKYFLNCSIFFCQYKNVILDIPLFPRFHEAVFEWNHKSIWKRHHPEIQQTFTDTENLKNVYNKYDLLIYSYIGTGFLESLSINKPFLLVSSLKEWPLKKEVYNDFMELKKANIFFEDNKSAIDHIDNIKSDTMSWWDNTETVRIKKNFINKYCMSLNFMNKLKNLNTILKNEKI